MKLTPDQIQAIRSLSFEAEAFLTSNLYLKTKEALDKTKENIIERLVNNVRADNETNLTRQEFVERLSAQYQTLYATMDIIKAYAEQVKQLDKVIENERNQSTS
jgi:hypothetical protein